MIWLWIYRIAMIAIIGIFTYLCGRSIRRIINHTKKMWKLKQEISEIKREILRLKEIANEIKSDIEKINQNIQFEENK